MTWLRILKEFQEFGRQKPKREKKDERGDIIYWHPEYDFYTIVRPASLRGWIKKHDNFLEVLQEAAKRKYPIYLRTSQTSQARGDSMRDTFYCKTYGMRIHPSICLSNRFKYPKKHSQDQEDEIEFLRYLMDKEKDPDLKRRQRRELSKKKKMFDPYPYCRRCKMSDRLEVQSCLGAMYDPGDGGCLACSDQTECCHLMRSRIEKIFEGKEEEVIEEVKKIYKQTREERIFDNQLLEKGREIMARKKKKDEEIIEVVEDNSGGDDQGSSGEEKETPESTPIVKKKRPAKKKKADPKPAEPSKKNTRSTGKANKGTDELTLRTFAKKPAEMNQKEKKAAIKALLEDLVEAKEAKENDLAKKIRAKLRALDYRLSDLKK